MTYDPTKSYSARVTPQSEPTPGRTDEVVNSAGGYTFAVDDWTRLDRFLVLGAEGGTYYATERKLTRENAACVERLLRADGPRLVRRVVEVSSAGRAPKNEPALFALALAMQLGDPETRECARTALRSVARTGTHLLHLAKMVNELGGWGRGNRRAFGAWFLDQPERDLAYQAVKYQTRDGWSLRDVLRLSHPKFADPGRRAIADWICGRPLPEEATSLGPALLRVRDAVHAGTVSPVEGVSLARLPREALPSEALARAPTWEALLAADALPLGALIRNLGNMTRLGVLGPLSPGTSEVVRRLTSRAGLARARVHPLHLLTALLVYRSGGGVRGSGTWEPVPAVVNALDEAFHASFGELPRSAARVLIGLDVSGSMGMGVIAGVPLVTPRVGSVCMAMATAAACPDHAVVAFTGSAALTPLDVSPRRRLDDNVARTERLPFGTTDCALPMLYATTRRLKVDAFVIYTDNETWAGNVKPFQALRKYREVSGIPARLVVVGMTSTQFTIADPTDAGMLDVVGFDAAAPAIIQDFIEGR
jgi:60 kDa SS-A/Ro ribonucleoprotein